MSKAMSLKARIRNLAKEKQIPAQVILQNYMFERLLVRLAASEYKDKFVLKGGMLVAAIVGLEKRATMDLDTTLKLYLQKYHAAIQLKRSHRQLFRGWFRNSTNTCSSS